MLALCSDLIIRTGNYSSVCNEGLPKMKLVPQTVIVLFRPNNLIVSEKKKLSCLASGKNIVAYGFVKIVVCNPSPSYHPQP